MEKNKVEPIVYEEIKKMVTSWRNTDKYLCPKCSTKLSSPNYTCEDCKVKIKLKMQF